MLCWKGGCQTCRDKLGVILREVHFCTTCDFQLPYCVRTDRRFCGKQCRIWWYRHRGIKRPDFPPGGRLDYPKRIKKGQPRTFAEALAALAEARAYTAQLEATARQQQTLENQFRNNLYEVSRALTDVRAKTRAAEDALQDALDAEKERTAESERRERAAAAQLNEQREQAEGQAERLKKAEEAAVEHKATADRHQQELFALRTSHEALQASAQRDATELTARLAQARRETDDLRKAQGREAERVADEIRELKSRREQLTAQRDTLAGQNAELTRSRDELRGQLDATARSLAQREGELTTQRQNFAAAERAHQEVHVVAESESRSLRAEKERRLAVEHRIEQLTLDLERMARETQTPTGSDPQLSLFQMRDDVLVAELKEVRLHRDEAIAERELLAARILKLMAPGQYLEHAAAAGYDLTKDPLIRLKREEVVVENRLAVWQEANKKRRRARRLDPEQTIDEQAYAAALSFRWKQINHPHLRRKKPPKWIAIGFLLDAESESYLLTLTEERVAEMNRKMQQAA